MTKCDSTSIDIDLLIGEREDSSVQPRGLYLLSVSPSVLDHLIKQI